MESTTKSVERGDTAAQRSSTRSDTNSTQTNNIMSKALTTSPDTARRKASTKTAPPFSMKRAASTPNVRTMAGAEALAISIAEKRRNKLGYHRTSVACGHCRRRKIRCLLAPEDPHGKCQNCIRLKKDCIFFPVEQHPDLDERPRSESKMETLFNEAGTSDSSSPSFTGSRIADRLDDSRQRSQHFPSSESQQDVQAVGTLTRSLTNPPIKGIPDGLLPVGQSADLRDLPWSSSFIQPSPQSSITDRASADDLSFWRHDPSMPTTYPQHPYSTMHSSTSLAHSSQSSVEQIPNLGHGDFQSWSSSPHPPLRSMSLVGPDQLPVHYQNQYYNNSTNEFHPSTNPSDVQPPVLSSNNSAMLGSEPPLSLPGVGFFQESAAPNISYVYPSSWGSAPPNHSPQMSRPGSDRFTHVWYSDPSSLAQVKEEDAISQFHHSTHPDNLAYQANPG